MSIPSFQEIRQNIENGEIIPENVVVHLLFKFMEILRMENNVVLLSGPINVVGDIHGQLYDLLKMFEASEGIEPNTMRFNPDKKYVFLGDYVDRGYQSLNTLLFLITIKLEYPNNITLLRGNHESRQVNMTYGFHSEIIAFYGNIKIWNMCNDMFDLLPLCALIDGKYFGVHGGLSRHAPLIEFITIENRMDEIPQDGLISELCWSDPSSEVKQFRQNPRGAGCIFGPSNITAFLRLNNLRMILRSHQLCQCGYQFFYREKASTNQKPQRLDFDVQDGQTAPVEDETVGLMTVWSAPNYAYANDNAATFCSLDQNNISLTCYTKSTSPKRIPDAYNRPTVSYYFA